MNNKKKKYSRPSFRKRPESLHARPVTPALTNIWLMSQPFPILVAVLSSRGTDPSRPLKSRGLVGNAKMTWSHKS